MKKIFVFCTTLLMVGMAQAQFPANLNEDSWQQSMNRIYVTGNVMDVELWPNGAPNSNGVVYDQPVKAGQGTIDMKPGLKVVLPPKSNKPSKAVVVCPGGGYAMLATMHEGIMWNFFFSRENVATIMLTYRLPHGNHEVPASDVYHDLVKVRYPNFFSHIVFAGLYTNGIYAIYYHTTCCYAHAQHHSYR